MFPDVAQLRRALLARISGLAASLPVRLAVAMLLVWIHLGMFQRAGHERLGMPFNIHASEAPYFSNPDASPFETPRQPHRWSRLIVSRYDAQHYIGTAERGLTACPHGASDGVAYLQCGLGWLPAWGTIGGTVSDVTTMPSDKVLLMLALIAALALNTLWTSEAIVRRLGRGPTWAAMFAFNAFPAAFYLVTPYCEGATLALGLAGFIALANERPYIAAALVGASTALQSSSSAFALGLACALLVMAWRRRTENRTDWWRPLLALPLCVWGLLVTMLALQIFVGDAFAYQHARDAFGVTYNWGHLVDGEYYMKALSGQDMDGAMLFALIAIIAFSAREVVKRLALVEATYVIVVSVTALVLSVVTPMGYWGMTRVLLPCLLAFFGLGLIAKKYPLLFVLWCVLSFAFYWHVDLCDYVTQGNVGACPNLGRAEVAVPLDE